MNLKNRQIELLHMLSESSGMLSTNAVLKQFKISKRTFYYDLQTINQVLSDAMVGELKTNNDIIDASGLNAQKIKKLIKNLNIDYISVEARRAYIVLYCTLESRPITLDYLAKTFKVSKNSVSNDIKALREELSSQNLELNTRVRNGYTVYGNELSIRKCIWSKLQELAPAVRSQDIKSLLQNALVQLCKNDIDYFELCRSLIKQYEFDLKTHCFLADNDLEGMMIQVSWLRGLQGHSVQMGPEEKLTLSATVSYRSVQCSVEKLKSAGLELPDEEIFYITSLLLGIKTTNFSEQQEEDAYVSNLAEQLINAFERVACLTFVNKAYINEQLIHHIRPLYYRQKYGLPVFNPLTLDVQKMYPMAFEFTRRAAQETGLGHLSNNELAYLTIYLSSDLDTKMLKDGDSSAIKVLIVGAENMSSVVLIQDQLADATGIDFKFSYTEASKLHRWQMETYALVLSLERTEERFHSSNYVEITPIISQDSILKIYDILSQNRIISRYSSMIEGLIDIFCEHVGVSKESLKDYNKLHFELFRYFDELNGQEAHGWLLPSAQVQNHYEVEVVPHGLSWHDALLFAAISLQKDFPTSHIVERMKSIMSNNRLLYYRAHPQIVVVRFPMQGEPEAEVNARIYKFNQPMNWDDGLPVTYMVCLATINRYSHWDYLYKFYSTLNSQESIEELLIVREGNHHDSAD